MALWTFMALLVASFGPYLTISEPISEMTCGHLFYRSVYMDQEKDILYVGAMDRLLKIQNLKNISETDCSRDSMILKSNSIPNCISRGKSMDYDCRNHIRVIRPIGDGSRLYICGTNAHSPKDEVIYANLTHLARHEFYPGIGDGIAKCPFDPEDNSTAIWVESGNPGDHPAIYSGTNAEFTKADAVIFRGDIFDETTGRREFTFKRTIKYDSHMLDKPDFVGSFEIGDFVYFFFRETAVEYMNCGKTIYSRVARVCKKDTGGKNILHQNWVTYLKARLNCSIAGDFPFFFDEIQDIYQSQDEPETLHGVFTTNQNGLKGTAICSFHLQDINKVFDEGRFKEQATSTSMWLPVPSIEVPEPRPGSCVQDTRDLPDIVLNFIRKHPLMESNVPHDAQAPAFYQKDTTFTKIVVDTVTKTTSYGLASGQKFTIYYAATEDGRIYKVARWPTSTNSEYQSRLLDIIHVTTPEPIRAMALSTKSKMLIVTSDYGIKQVPIQTLCSKRYQNCVQCVHDPYCGWNREEGICQDMTDTNTYLLQDPQGVAEGICEASLPIKKIVANFGSSVHLSCAIENIDQPVHWFFYDIRDKRHPILPTNANSKHVLTQNNGLVIIGVKESDAGKYECRLGRESVTSYDLSIDLQRCQAPNKTADYQKIYSEWCSEFQKYKTALKTWEENKNKCGGPPPPAPKSSEHAKNEYNSVYNNNPLI